MRSDDKDLPVANDYKKSTEGQGFQLPDVLTSGTGVLIGFAIVLVIGGLFWIFTNVKFSRPAANPLESRPGFASLKKQVENLAEVDQLCATKDRTLCLCEFSDRLRDDHRAIDQILAADPLLKPFSIVVSRAGAPTMAYTLDRLPKQPDESVCLNSVAAPTIIDDGSGDEASPTTTTAPATEPSASPDKR